MAREVGEIFPLVDRRTFASGTDPTSTTVFEPIKAIITDGQETICVAIDDGESWLFEAVQDYNNAPINRSTR